MEQAMKKRGGGGGGGFLSGIFGKSAKDDEAAELFVKAANVFKMGKHWREAGDAFSKAAEAHSSKNSRHDSASALVDAANCYRKCEAKVAHLDADAGDYINAAKVFEELGKAAMENSLLKYGAKDHFFRACLCHLNIDVLNCQQALEKYAEMHPAFTDSREYKLMVKLVETPTPRNRTSDEFDSISRLDPWATRRLNTVKKALKADEPELT
uniref:TPR_REGION domain-containing protein n=1 Tax=Macrostomum lignano TaxID=282301 RepID=A0A1I8JK33_9PLAT